MVYYCYYYWYCYRTVLFVIDVPILIFFWIFLRFNTLTIDLVLSIYNSVFATRIALLFKSVLIGSTTPSKLSLFTPSMHTLSRCSLWSESYNFLVIHYQDVDPNPKRCYVDTGKPTQGWHHQSATVIGNKYPVTRMTSIKFQIHRTVACYHCWPDASLASPNRLSWSTRCVHCASSRSCGH